MPSKEATRQRYFSAYYIFFRFMLIVSGFLSTSRFYLPLAAILLTIAALLFFIFQPYKNKNDNMIDIVSIILAALFYMTVIRSRCVCITHWSLLVKGCTSLAIWIGNYLLNLSIALLISKRFYTFVSKIFKQVFFRIKNYKNAKSCEGFDKCDYPSLLKDAC